MMLAYQFFEVTISDVVQAVVIAVAAIIWLQKMRDKLHEVEARVQSNVEAIKKQAEVSQNMNMIKQAAHTLEEFARECSHRQEERHNDLQRYFREISERTARIEGKLDRINGKKDP